MRLKGDTLRRHPEFLQGGFDLGHGWPARRRSEGQVDGGRDAPSQRQGRHHVVGVGKPQIHGGGGDDGQGRSSQPAQGPGQVGRRGGHDRGGDAQAQKRKRRALPQPHGDVEAAHEALLDRRAEDAGNDRCQQGGEQHVTGKTPPAGDQRGDQDEAVRPEVCELVHPSEQASEPAGQGVDDGEQLTLERCWVPDAEGGERHDDARDDQAVPVGGAPLTGHLRRGAGHVHRGRI